MGGDVRLQQLVLLQQVVHRRQIFPIILRGQQSLHLRTYTTRLPPHSCLDRCVSTRGCCPHLREPEVKVLDARVEVLLLVGLLQLLALLSRLVDQELPLLIQSTEPALRDRTEGSDTSRPEADLEQFWSSSSEGTHLDGILAASAGSSLDQGVTRVDDPTDPVCVSMQLRFEGLVLLMLALTQ